MNDDKRNPLISSFEAIFGKIGEQLAEDTYLAALGVWVTSPRTDPLDLVHLQTIHDELRAFQNVDLYVDDITDSGNPVILDWRVVRQFEFTGLLNRDFFDGNYHLLKWCDVCNATTDPDNPCHGVSHETEEQ